MRKQPQFTTWVGLHFRAAEQVRCNVRAVQA